MTMSNLPSSAPEFAAASDRRYVLMAVAGEVFGLASDNVVEVLPLPELARPAHLPPITEGLLNLGGHLIPVIRLDLLLGLAGGQPGVYAHLVVVEFGNTRVALLADRAVDLIRAPASRVCPVDSNETYRDCVRAEISGWDRPVHVLAIDRLLSVREREVLDALCERECRHAELFEDSQ